MPIPHFLETSRDHLPAHCRLLVVGGGLVGLEIAKELDRRGMPDVLLLEAGPARDLRHANLAHPPDRALRLWLEPGTDEYFRQPWTSGSPPHYTGSSGIRQRLGGRSLYWYGVALPIEATTLADASWPAPVVSDLCESWRGGPALYERVERMLCAWRAPAAPLRGFAGDTTTSALGALRLRRTPRAVRQASADPERWFAYSALDHWRDPMSGRVLHRPTGLQIQSGVEVLRIVVRAGAACGAVVRHRSTGEQMEIAADGVVLAAGTLENSRLAVQALREAGALARPRLTGLCDHLVQGVFLRLQAPHAARVLDVLRPGCYYATYHDRARSNLFLDLQPLPGGELLVDLQMTGEQLPSADNYVECHGPAPGPWPVNVNAAPREADLAMLAAQRDILQEAAEEIATITGHAASELDFGDFDSPDRTNAFVLPEAIRTAPAGEPMTWSGFLGTEDHEGGTLPLGTVLTVEHEFAAIRRLFAAGPSAFPRMGAANPSLTSLALAHRLAAILAG